MIEYTEMPDLTPSDPEDCIHEVVWALNAYDTGRCGLEAHCCLTGKDADIDYGQAHLDVIRANAGDDGVHALIQTLATFEYAGVCPPESDCEFVRQCALMAGYALDGDYDAITVGEAVPLFVPWVEGDDGIAKTAEALVTAADAWVDEHFHPAVAEAWQCIERWSKDEEEA